MNLLICVVQTFKDPQLCRTSRKQTPQLINNKMTTKLHHIPGAKLGNFDKLYSYTGKFTPKLPDSHKGLSWQTVEGSGSGTTPL